MPVENDKAAINARRAELLSGGGIKDGSAKYSGSKEGGNTARIASAGSPDSALAAAMQDYFRKHNIAKTTNSSVVNDVAEYTSSKEVVTAIKEGKLAKSQAITYCEKFQLVTADKIDELTPSAALNILNEDSEEEVVHEQIIAQMVNVGPSKDSTVNSAKPEDGQPTPDGKENMKGQLPSHTVSKDSTVNSAKPEDGQPTPDGSVNVQKQIPNTKISDDSTVNTAKPEENFPTPVKAQTNSQMVNVGPSKDSTVNTAKPEDGQPKPDGKENMKGQLPSHTVSKDSTVNSAKPEDAPALTKASKEVRADGIMDMLGADKGAPDAGSGLGDLKKMTPIEEIEKAIDLIADFKEIFDSLQDKLEKKDKKEKKPFGGGKDKEDKKPEGEKKDDKPKEDKKPEGEKKDSPFPPKKEDKPADDAPLPAELPQIMSYKVDLVKDEKSPEDSYYVVSLAKTPVFSVSARHAFGKEVKANLASFLSDEYSKELGTELNAQGAKHVFQNVFGSVGIVLAQAEKLPEDKFDAPAKDMNVTPEAGNNIVNNETQKQSYSDLLIETLAMNIASDKSSTASEAVDELRGVFSDENKAKEFEGRLAEKIEQKKKDIDSAHAPAGGTGAATPAPAAPAAPASEEMKSMAAALKQVKEMMPEIKAAIKERDELKAQLIKIEASDRLKARATATYEVAMKKATAGLIDKEDIKQEALRLAKLSDAELSEEVKIFENSLKIANKIKESTDYSKIENNTVKEVVAGKLLDAVPSMMDDEKVAPTFQWSKGIKSW